MTTGTFLAWAILLMVLNPDVQERFRREILGKIKNRTSSDLNAIELKSYGQTIV